MRPLALLACLAVLVLTGCGGDEERRATSTETTETTESVPDTGTRPPVRTVTEPPRTITVPAKPPPKGRFEKRCAKDPQACG